MEESNVSSSSAVEASSLAAYESLKEEIAAVADGDLIHINVDIPTAVTTVLRSLAGLRALRTRLLALAEFDVEQFDKLERYTRAAFYANMLYTVAARPTESMPELTEEATGLRDLLYSDARALVQRGLLNGDELRVVKAATGYRPLANDLIALAAVLGANWERVSAKTAVLEEDLKRAQRLSDRILNAVSQREQAASSTLATATLERNRAYTLFFRAYDNARRAVSYLRWREADMEKIAPSLFAGRSTGRRKLGDDVGPADEPGFVEAGETMSDASAPPIAPAAQGALPAPAPVPVGLPGADPFIRT